MSIFENEIDRTQTKSVKWDLRSTVFQSDDVLPMWVADTDFQAPKEVNKALMKRAEHGIYGYTVVDQTLKDSIIHWNKSRHNWEIDEKWLTFSNGVVTSLHMAIQAFTQPNDSILIQTPVYTPFYSVIEGHNRNVVRNELQYDDGYYTIDFVDFEDKLKQDVKMFLLCSPHNPVGRVWKKEELEEMARLCLKYDVLMVSDEIHADLTFPGVTHFPLASLSPEISNQTITCMAPSKTFNLAGLDASYVITENEEMKKQLEQVFELQGFHNMLNTMGNLAMEAAYTHGAPWLDELQDVIQSHYHYVKNRFEKEAPELKVVDSEGTYLLWIDCSALQMNAKELRKFFVEVAKVGMNAGVDYGDEGEQFMRLNVGCTRATLEEAVNRMVQAVNNR